MHVHMWYRLQKCTHSVWPLHTLYKSELQQNLEGLYIHVCA